MLDIMEKFAQEKGYTYLRMDGGTGISSRQPMVHRYNTVSTHGLNSSVYKPVVVKTNSCELKANFLGISISIFVAKLFIQIEVSDITNQTISFLINMEKQW